MEYQKTGHRIHFNHSNALPRYILAVDVVERREQIDVSGKLYNREFAGCCVVSGRYARDKITGQRVNEFATSDEFWEYVFSFTRPNYTTWLVADNALYKLVLAGMAHKFTCGELHVDKPRSKRRNAEHDTESPLTSGLAVIEAPPTVIGCRVGKTQGRIVIVDYRNWFPPDLHAGETAQGSKTANEHLDSDTNCPAGARCKQDAIKLHSDFTKLIGWVKEKDLGLFRYTSSSQAYGAYRHRFMRQQIYVHDNEPMQRIEHNAHFGGRSEVFRYGDFSCPVHLLDINALFPSVMYQGWYPYKLTRTDIRSEFGGRLPEIDWSAAVAEVKIRTDSDLYPIRWNNSIIYPFGHFYCTLSGPDLYRAYRAGAILEVRSWGEYKLGMIFRDWVEEFWKLRREYKAEGNRLYEQFTKRIMNSLYGKFGQLTPAWVNAESDYSLLPFTTESRMDENSGEWVTLRAIGWQVQRLEKRRIKPGSFYAIPAFVTALARHRMDTIRAIAGPRNVFYQGVDSVIVNDAGLRSLDNAGEIQPDTIGKLRLQYSANTGYIHGISNYRIGSKIVVAGLASNHERDKHGEIMQHKLYTTEQLFKRGPSSSVLERVEPWLTQPARNKGHVGSDGWVTPFTLEPYSADDSAGSSPDVEAVSAKALTRIM